MDFVQSFLNFIKQTSFDQLYYLDKSSETKIKYGCLY